MVVVVVEGGKSTRLEDNVLGEVRAYARDLPSFSLYPRSTVVARCGVMCPMFESASEEPAIRGSPHCKTLALGLAARAEELAGRCVVVRSCPVVAGFELLPLLLLRRLLKVLPLPIDDGAVRAQRAQLAAELQSMGEVSRHTPRHASPVRTS